MVVGRTRGTLRPLLWPGRLHRRLTRVRSLTEEMGTQVSFLVEYSSPNGATFMRFGAHRIAVPESSVRREAVIRDVTATLQVGADDLAGEVWLWWKEPGAWRPGGVGDTVLPSVEYQLHARGLPVDELLAVAAGR